jgi:hypothetical protein
MKVFPALDRAGARVDCPAVWRWVSATWLAVAISLTGIGLAILPASALAPPPKLSRVLDDYYSPVSLTFPRGGTVRWVWSTSNLHAHNLRLAKAPKGVDKSRFRSPTKVRRFRFERTFTIAGNYQFFCTLHPFTMRQTVMVRR